MRISALVAIEQLPDLAKSVDVAAFDDDELERYYRLMEERTAARAADSTTRRLHRRIADELVGCPTPSKTAFTSRADAAAAITSMSVGTWRTVSLRTYRCQCGSWHLTSSTRDD
ncbi:hypothetical protein [Gordonia asplenii]|uniref:hypothetical protein n=1 Tax=Gordonia asplenii TaxID=2725283 RepID=UPI001FEA81E3|nr:hypothetical protein [Gordonia asplenii]